MGILVNLFQSGSSAEPAQTSKSLSPSLDKLIGKLEGKRQEGIRTVSIDVIPLEFPQELTPDSIVAINAIPIPTHFVVYRARLENGDLMTDMDNIFGTSILTSYASSTLIRHAQEQASMLREMGYNANVVHPGIG